MPICLFNFCDLCELFQNKNGTPNIQSPIASVPVKKMVHFSTPKPFQPSNPPPVVPSASLTEQIRQQAAKASADEVPFDFPPPPPELLEPLESPGKPMPPPPEFVESPEKVPPPPASNPPQSRDPLFGFLDFLDDDKEAKKLPGRIKSPFLSGNKFNSSPKPFSASPTADTFRQPKVPAGSPQFRPPGISNGPKRLLTTDLDNDPLPSRSPPAPLAPPAHVYTIQMQPDSTKDHPASVNNNKSPIPPVKDVSGSEKLIILEVEKVWLCQNCTEPVKAGEVAIFAERAGSDRCWHPQCFCCTICNVSLLHNLNLKIYRPAESHLLSARQIVCSAARWR